MNIYNFFKWHLRVFSIKFLHNLICNKGCDVRLTKQERPHSVHRGHCISLKCGRIQNSTRLDMVTAQYLLEKCTQSIILKTWGMARNYEFWLQLTTAGPNYNTRVGDPGTPNERTQKTFTCVKSAWLRTLPRRSNLPSIWHKEHLKNIAEVPRCLTPALKVAEKFHNCLTKNSFWELLHSGNIFFYIRLIPKKKKSHHQ